MPSNNIMDMHPFNRIQFSNENEQNTTGCNNTDVTNMMLRERSQTQRNTHCNSIYIEFKTNKAKLLVLEVKVEKD